MTRRLRVLLTFAALSAATFAGVFPTLARATSHAETVHVAREAVRADTSSHTVRFIDVSPDVRIEVLDWGGAGDALVFLAGLSNNAHAFDGFAPRFTDRHRVLGITRRGHGASSWPESGYDLDTLVGDILTVLDSLVIRRAIFAGHSFGGSELTYLASAHPDRVLGLIYIDAVQDLTHIETAMQHCAFGAELETAAQQQFAEPEAFRRTQLRTQADGSVGPNASVQAMPQLIQGAIRRDYSLVRAPALAVSYVPERSEDIFFGRDLSDECVTVVQRITYGGLAAFAAGMQRGTVVALRDGQHNLHLVSPVALETAMRRWLDRRKQ